MTASNEIMNCEEYREAIAADPSFDGGAGHLTQCEACQAYRSEMLALDERISRALAIDVPELVIPELPNVDTENVVALSGRRRLSPPAWLAVAATVAIAAFLGARFVGNGVEYDSLADEVLAHLDHEPYALRVTDKRVSDRRLRSVVPADVAAMTTMTDAVPVDPLVSGDEQTGPTEEGTAEVVPSTEDLVALAERRRTAVFDYFTQTRGVVPERLFNCKPTVSESAEETPAVEVYL